MKIFARDFYINTILKHSFTPQLILVGRAALNTIKHCWTLTGVIGAIPILNCKVHVCVHVAIYQNYKLNERKFQICTCAKANNSCSVEVDTMDPSLCNYTPSDAMNVTVDHEGQGRVLKDSTVKLRTVVKFDKGHA